MSEAITTEDWPEMQPQPETRRHSLRDHLNTGVRVLEDGRLDIKFHERKPFITRLASHLQALPPEPTAGDRRPSVIAPPGEEERCPLRLNIVVQVVGSRGDVQPFIALGKMLKKCGHRVRLATHLAFRDSILDQGLEFFNIGGDPAELMAFMVKNEGLIPSMDTLRSGAIPKRRREMKAIFSGCWRSCYETGDGTGLHHIPEDPWSDTVDYRLKPFVADAIIANPPSFAHLSCAEKLGVPLNMMFTMPWTPTQSFPHPLANIIRSRSSKPSAANFASYAVVEIMMWEGLGDLINKFRTRELGLDPLDAIRAPSISQRLDIPYTYFWSPALLPKPADWASGIDICGFCFLDRASTYTPPADLQAFIDAGDPPIYVGFGSIVVDNPRRLTEIVFDAIAQAGVRAIVSAGWGNIGSGATSIPSNIHMIGRCPHDWLFQHVSSVVHHGGAGTTAAGLVLGRPTIVVPFFGDQPFWGSIVARAGAGPKPLPYKSLTSANLAEALRQTYCPEMRRKAADIGEMMRKEKGVCNAACSFHRHLKLDRLCCDVCPDRPAVWWIKRSRIRLSTFAAAVLVETGLLKSHHIVLYRSQEYDTTRNPRGPLSAGAEVLYGVVSDFIAGVAGVPGDVSDMIEHHHAHHEHRHRHGFNWLKRKANRENNGDETPNQGSDDSGVGNGVTQATTPRQPNDADAEHAASDGDSTYASAEEEQPQHQEPQDNGNSSPSVSTSTRLNDENEDDDESSEASKSTFEGEALDLERTITRRREKEERGRSRKYFQEQGYRARRMGKHILNWTITIPTDLTLSLSKGFHNAPRLYHDTTVEDLPKVMGWRSGFRAAGIEFTRGFYHGITGVVLQPQQGFRDSGGGGLCKGVGKGIGGFFLKPAAGMWGLAGYPLDGLHKSLRNSLSRSKTHDIVASRISQGLQEMCLASTDERAEVIRRWHALLDRKGLDSNGMPLREES
ncbi:putative UDP-glucose,sterol transferase [Aspergillus candidus]|uniref:UDP-Glycosyltransferase/glycogen phosphorylase n=1 Tax=Aspergillus candidus TaxID=41067 RepID=A0A2I2F936_ASPCN|nr:UDP-Glycosyltransferase/glycogen phosphorylase [Aspergillus candidus]PLB37140.1 UDP-Glycosyltransferase/glycogen phosphorylase [Aspergillus candidus]